MTVLSWFVSYLNTGNITALIILLAVFFVTYVYLAKAPWKNLPPGPPILPVLGSLPFLGGDPREVFRKMATRYGPVWMARLGVHDTVFICGYQAIYAALVKHGSMFLHRPDTFHYNDFYEYSAVGSTTDPEVWIDKRRFMLRVLKNLGYAKGSMGSRVLMEVERFLKEVDEQEAKPFDPIPTLKASTGNITSQMAFGKIFAYDDPQYNSLLKLMGDIEQNVGNENLLNNFPYLKNLPSDLVKYHETMKMKNELFQVFKIWIEEHKINLGESNEPRDFIEAYLLEMSKEKHPEGRYTERDLMFHIFELLVTGCETASVTIGWAILYLVINADLQDKLFIEILHVIGKDRLPALDDRSRMPLMEAFISEVQRIGDIVPFALPRSTGEDVEFEGYSIPKGTMVLINLNSVHWDPTAWPEPDKFDIGRFLDAHGQYVMKDHFLPFGLGRRSCPGENLGQMKLFLYITSIIQRYTIRLPEGAPPTDTQGLLGLTVPPKPYKALFEKRN